MNVRHAAVMAGLALGLTSGAANAAYVLDINQVGGNVVASGSGTLNLLDLTFGGFLEPNAPGVSGTYVEAGNSDNYADFYGPITGPSDFGTGAFTAASSASGYNIGIDAAAGELIIPGGVSFNNFDFGVSTATFSNTTIAALGLRSGSYTYTWGDANPDSFTLNISAVPLPASAPLFGAALLALAGFGYGMNRWVAPKDKKQIAAA